LYFFSYPRLQFSEELASGLSISVDRAFRAAVQAFAGPAATAQWSDALGLAHPEADSANQSGPRAAGVRSARAAASSQCRRAVGQPGARPQRTAGRSQPDRATGAADRAGQQPGRLG